MNVVCQYKVCDCGIFSMDSITPYRVPLSAYYKRSFAFFTIKERLPVILTKLIDSLVRDKEEITAKFGVEAKEELKIIIGELSKLKYEMQTNKPIEPIESNEPDALLYNQYLEEQNTITVSRYFTAIWLHAECYMYRRIKCAFEKSKNLKSYDYFQKQKLSSFTQSMNAVNCIGEYLSSILTPKEKINEKEELIKLIKVNLWGNRCDLSISAGEQTYVLGNPISILDKYDPFIISNHTENIWKLLLDIHSSNKQFGQYKTIEYIVDNAGYELFTDMCLADFLITYHFAEVINFHLKAMPWFISDASHDDLRTLIRLMINDNNGENVLLKQLGIRWNKYIREGIWVTFADPFWTLPVDYTKMETYAPDLYDKLCKADLAIFKGDLNYRKLFGEINWEPTTPVRDALQNFYPTKLCIFRTIKADIICGLEKGLAEEMDQKDPKWMISGNYGVIQCSD